MANQHAIGLGQTLQNQAKLAVSEISGSHLRPYAHLCPVFRTHDGSILSHMQQWLKAGLDISQVTPLALLPPNPSGPGGVMRHAPAHAYASHHDATLAGAALRPGLNERQRAFLPAPSLPGHALVTQR